MINCISKVYSDQCWILQLPQPLSLSPSLPPSLPSFPPLPSSLSHSGPLFAVLVVMVTGHTQFPTWILTTSQRVTPLAVLVALLVVLAVAVVVVATQEPVVLMVVLVVQILAEVVVVAAGVGVVATPVV